MKILTLTSAVLFGLVSATGAFAFEDAKYDPEECEALQKRCIGVKEMNPFGGKPVETRLKAMRDANCPQSFVDACDKHKFNPYTPKKEF